MSTVLTGDRSGHSLLLISCDGCPRSASTDAFGPEAFRALIGWVRDDGSDWCTFCQKRRGRTAPIARRVTERA